MTLTLQRARPAAAPAGAATAPAATEREYGLYAMVAGLLVLVGLDSAALAVLSPNVNGAVAVIGTISAPVVAMVSAYFGVKIGAKSGSASAAAAHKARQEAETAVRSLLLHTTPDQVRPVMRTLGLPVTDNDTPSQAAA